MPGRHRLGRLALAALVALVSPGCGPGSGSAADSGANQTHLSVDAADPDGDALHYQWRVTAGQIDNRDARETVWTLPDGPGLHFAYVRVSDGQGGHVVHQYAVSSDALDTPATTRAAVVNTLPAITDPAAVALRLRFHAGDQAFVPGEAASARRIYLPDVPVQVWERPDPALPATRLVFTGSTDLGGDVSVPGLQPGVRHEVRCSTTPGLVPTSACGTVSPGSESSTLTLAVAQPAGQNLRLFGHVGLADGSLCGVEDSYFGLQTAARVQLLQADGAALAPAVRVNRYGDYALDAAVPVKAALQLRVQCEGHTVTLAVPPSADPSGYLVGQPVQLSHTLANSRPSLRRMVANGPDGNLRGREIVAEAGAESNRFPGSDHFLTLRGKDTAASACRYYRAIGAAADCDAQGRPLGAISLDDWKRKNRLSPYRADNVEWQATYINKMDLNLVRRMAATAVGGRVAFNVCNHPGPDGTSQTEVDRVMDTALADERMVACVSMEWSSVPGIDQPFTQFLAFGPDGTLLPSVNLDGRGEKYLPGACVSCHGSTRYGGRFPDSGNPSPDLGARFLPFDTGNYLFPSRSDFTEVAQAESIYQLNQLVRTTEFAPSAAPGAGTPTSRLVDRWYTGSSRALDKAAVPPAWDGNDRHRRLYREVVGAVCRTCHTAMGSTFDWDGGSVGNPALLTRRGSAHLCGGGSDPAVNASMPNALISLDKLQTSLRADPGLAALMADLLGCSVPQPDPVYPRR